MPKDARSLGRGLNSLLFSASLGFLALLTGSALVAPWVVPTASWLAHPQTSRATALLVLTLLSRGWILCVLPLFCLLVGRISTRDPWPTALGAAVAGESFLLFLDVALGGALSAWEGGWSIALRAISWVLGTALSAWAFKRGRAWKGDPTPPSQT